MHGVAEGSMTEGIENYSIYELLSRGYRFMWEWGPEDAIARYLELHPEKAEAEIRAELDEALRAHGETIDDWAPYMPEIVQQPAPNGGDADE